MVVVFASYKLQILGNYTHIRLNIHGKSYESYQNMSQCK